MTIETTEPIETTTTETIEIDRQKINEVLAVLWASSPFFANFLPFLNIYLTDDPEIQTACCTKDGNIYLNIKYVQNEKSHKIVCTILHEIMHLITGDFPRADSLYREFESKGVQLNAKSYHMLTNIVFDIINNYLLSEGFKGFDYAVEHLNILREKAGISEGLHKEEFLRRLIEKADEMVKAGKTIEEVMKSSHTKGGNHGGKYTIDDAIEICAIATVSSEQKNANNGTAVSSDMNFDKPPKKVGTIFKGKEHDPNKWTDNNERAALVRSIMKKTRHIGNIPAGLYTYISQLTTPKIKWDKYLTKLVTHKLDIWVTTYARRSRRERNLPGIRTFGYAKIVILLDTSGSISMQELVQFVSEIMALVRRYHASLTVVPFDADAYTPIEIRHSNDINALKKLPGGGGTCIKPPIELLSRGKYKLTPNDICVIFTDGYIYDLNDPYVQAFMRRIRPIVVTTGKTVYPELLVNIKV